MPVPGGPSSTTCAPASSAETSSSVSRALPSTSGAGRDEAGEFVSQGAHDVALRGAECTFRRVDDEQPPLDDGIDERVRDEIAAFDFAQHGGWR